MAVNVETIVTQVLEKTTARLSGVIKDEAGAPIPSSSLDTLKLTLFSRDDAATPYAVINSRNDQSVLNANNVTVDGSGNLVWTLQPADTAILDDTLSEEWHRAVFVWTYSTGTKTGRHVIDFCVKNLQKLT